MKKIRFTNPIIRSLIIIIAVIQLLSTSTLVFVTAWKLWNIERNITIYNELPIKTDADTELVQKYYEQREKLYNSTDIIVSDFSKSNVFVKLIVLILVIVSIPYDFSIIWTQVKRIIRYIAKRANHN